MSHLVMDQMVGVLVQVLQDNTLGLAGKDYVDEVHRILDSTPIEVAREFLRLWAAMGRLLADPHNHFVNDLFRRYGDAAMKEQADAAAKEVLGLDVPERFRDISWAEAAILDRVTCPENYLEAMYGILDPLPIELVRDYLRWRIGDKDMLDPFHSSDGALVERYGDEAMKARLAD